MKDEIDVLKRLEELTARMNELFGSKGRNVFNRYPLTFALLILFGVTMVTQGVKDLLLEIPFLKSNPFVMLFIGLLILAITGSLYKKLKK